MTIESKRLVTIVSIVIVTTMTLLNLEIIQNAVNYIIALKNATELDKFELRLATTNFLFRLTGIVLVILGLIELFKNKDKISLIIKILWTYVIMLLVLLLPIYHRHPVFVGGQETHGHTFWDGGLHFH